MTTIEIIAGLALVLAFVAYLEIKMHLHGTTIKQELTNQVGKVEAGAAADATALKADVTALAAKVDAHIAAPDAPAAAIPPIAPGA